jgi:hypothetical protein
MFGFMVTRKQVAVTSGLILVIGGVVTFVYLWTIPHHVLDFDTYRKIRAGMDAAEVERVIGFPPGNYSETKLPRGWEAQRITLHRDEHVMGWATDKGLIRVLFDRTGRVIHVTFDYNLPPESLIERVRNWLGI